VVFGVLATRYPAQALQSYFLRILEWRSRTEGYRGFEVLHVATALHLGVTEFLTFDGNQKKLAEAEGLLVPV
jgi:hypothetical protein